jgi:hypothetical protein
VLHHPSKVPLAAPILAGSDVTNEGVVEIAVWVFHLPIRINENEGNGHIVYDQRARPGGRYAANLGNVRAMHHLCDGKPTLLCLSSEDFYAMAHIGSPDGQLEQALNLMDSFHLYAGGLQCLKCYLLVSPLNSDTHPTVGAKVAGDRNQFAGDSCFRQDLLRP